jgi:hypothetical protein
MPLSLLYGPSVVSPYGAIVEVRNAKTSGSQGMDWSFEQFGGWYQGNRKYTNTLRVITNDPRVGPIQIQQFILGMGVLQGSYYQFPLTEYINGALSNPAGGITEQDTGSFCQTVTIKPETSDGKQWLATFSYSALNIYHEYGSSEAQNGSINPLESAPVVKWSGVIYEITYPQDANGVPFLNTVGDPFENPPKVEEARQSLSFVRNEATYNDNYAQQFRMSLNSDVFLGFQPLQAKCKNIDGERIYSSDYGYYWRVSYEFEFRIAYFYSPSTQQTTTYGFQEIVLNAGLRKLLSNGTLSQILVDGTPITNPVALTKDGVPLNSTWAQSASSNPNPYYLIFQNYPTQAFAQLNIPPNILTQNQ